MTNECANATFSMQFARPGERAWLRVGAAAMEALVHLNGREVGTHLGPWTPFEFEISEYLQDDNTLRIHCTDQPHRGKSFLELLDIHWTGVRDVEVRTEPTPHRPAAEQRANADGISLLVDGRPFRVRGVLHWGYYPELGNPWPDEQQIRREITDMKSLGFNLVKFCLWIPPERYYQLCEEMNMFVWQEYPFWDTPLDDPAIVEDYRQFFLLDRPYSCVILRTLTCENDRVDPILAKKIVNLAHEMIPGSLVLDNSAWLSNQCFGDFHDEHPYLHNAQWRYYGKRMRHRLTKPLLLGETMCADTSPDGSSKTALAIRRFQIETLSQDLPEAGYVVCAIRDIPKAPLGLYALDGKLKYTPEEWAWHAAHMGPPRKIPDANGPIIGPRKGEWKCREYTWWSPIVKVLDPGLPADLIERECVFDLLSGRVLDRCEGTRALVEVLDVHDRQPGEARRLPLVIEFKTQGQRRIVSAFRHDTAAGRELWEMLCRRQGDAPEIGPLVGTSIVLADWEMSLDERTWTPVKCDTPLVNGGKNVFEGWATFRTRFDYPGGQRVLRCEAVGDYYEILIDGVPMGEAGNRTGTWDGTRDVPRNFEVDLSRGTHELVVHVRDWRAAGGMVGPVYLATDLDERIF